MATYALHRLQRERHLYCQAKTQGRASVGVGRVKFISRGEGGGRREEGLQLAAKRPLKLVPRSPSPPPLLLSLEGRPRLTHIVNRGSILGERAGLEGAVQTV